MKRFLSILIAMVMVFALAGCGGGNQTPNGDVTKNDAETLDAVNIGESVDSGYWNIKIESVEELNEIKGHNEDDLVKANGKFIAILGDMKNISNEPLSYSLYEFKLMDLKTEKVYTVQDNGVESSIKYISEEKFYNKNPDYITINDSVNPDDTKIGCIVFDINPELDIKNLVLLNENDGSEEGTVQFKLSE